MNQRRKFLSQLFTGSLATIAIPSFANEIFKPDFSSLESGDVNDERYWQLVKKQFSVPQNLVMLNAANLCPSPYIINDIVNSAMTGLQKDVSFQYRSQFSAKRTRSIEMMAQFIDATKDELGIVRNTSEANTILVQGLDFTPGDEIILWDQNHPSNGVAWEQRAKRDGLVIKKVSLPPSPKTINELVEQFAKAITSKTKLIAFSHISNTSGMALPAKEICQLARTKKVLTLVDGAQSLGMMDLNLTDIGCDFYTASTHKWLMGPFENGILYIRKDFSGKLFPNVISAGWKDTSVSVDDRLCILGQRNETTPFAIPETLEFHLTIGKKNIEDRVRKLNSYLKEQIQSKIPTATFVSPSSSDTTAGITIINLPGKTPQDINQKLYTQYGIAVAPSGGVRMSPHIYNTLEDLDRVVEALSRV